METVTHISMQVIILAAGKGIRMGDLTADIPKPMLPLLGKPLLEWRLAMLPEAVREVIFVVGYLGDQIEKYFGSEWQGRSIRYVRHEKLEGTGGAMRRVYGCGLFLGPALVTNVDDVYCILSLNIIYTGIASYFTVSFRLMTAIDI